MRIDIGQVVRRKVELGGHDALSLLLRDGQVPVIGEGTVLVARRQLHSAIGDDAVVERNGDDRRAELTEIDTVTRKFVIEVEADLQAVEQVLARADIEEIGAFDLQRTVRGRRRRPRSRQAGAIESLSCAKFSAGPSWNGGGVNKRA